MAARGSGNGIYVLALAVAVTSGVGLVVNNHRRAIYLPVRTPTRASLAIAKFGIDQAPLDDVPPGRDLSALQRNAAMWVKFRIPNGSRNFPAVIFELRDDAGRPFPFATSWIRDGAYMFVPKGYDNIPNGLTAMIRQKSVVVGRAELPRLPPPASLPPPPKLIPPWPGLRVVRCRSGDVRRDDISILVSAKIAHGHALRIYTHGSSSCASEPFDGGRFLIPREDGDLPGKLDIELNFPDYTKTLYLDVQEISWTPGAVHGIAVRPLSLPLKPPKVFSRARIAVPLDTEPAELPPHFRKVAPFFFAGAPPIADQGRFTQAR